MGGVGRSNAVRVFSSKHEEVKQKQKNVRSSTSYQLSNALKFQTASYWLSAILKGDSAGLV